MSKLSHRYHQWLVRLVLVFLIAGALPTPFTPRAQAAGEVPLPLIDNRIISDWTVGGPRLLGLSYPDCSTYVPPHAGIESVYDPVQLWRVSTSGGSPRAIFSRNDPRPAGTCNPYILNSNIVADGQYVYWVDGTQLVRLSVEANPGDPPQAWGPTFGSTAVELAVAGDYIISMQGQSCRFCLLGTRFNLISRATGASNSTFRLAEFGSKPAYDGTYIYYIATDNSLQRFTPGSSATALQIAQNVAAYVAEGDVSRCSGFTCTTTSYIFYIQTLGLNSIVRYNNRDGGYQLIYLSNPGSGQVGQLYGLARSNLLLGIIGGDLFFFEKRYVPCPVPPGCFVTGASDLLLRVGRFGGTPDVLYIRDTDTAHHAQGLKSDGQSIYWKEQGTESPVLPAVVKRLPADADALPKINLVATGLEITQGIQRSDNSVKLIQLRPTFVRFFVRADGQSVPGVTAQLQVSSASLGTTTLAPVNPDLGSRIRVLVSPSRGVTNDSFIFELPWQYTQVSDLQLRATVNPYGVPLEPTLGDNTIQAGAFSFVPTPRLSVTFVELPYNLNGTTYRPQGTLKNVNWIRRVYPLGASIGVNGWNFGLNYNIWELNDAGLAARVNRNLPECEGYVTRDGNGMITKDERELCASGYINGVLRDLRSRRSVPDGTFLYGEIRDSGVANQFPRGQEGGNSTSSGPDGPGWDGYYSGHEIGHSLGLGHPKTADGNCGLEGSDPQPPYTNGWIGKADSSIVGFDSADGTLGGKRAVLGGASWFDVMAYCQPQWISDVNYERIYKRLTGTTSLLAAPAAETGDWLSVYGSIDASGSRAAVDLLRRLAGTVTPPARTPGDYALRLLNGASAKIAEYAFTPEAADDSTRANFGLVVPFAAGARQLQIVRLSTGKLLYSQAISANAPVVSNVKLQGAPGPVSGISTLNWAASDADGNQLRYDVLFSRNGGSSFTPLFGSLSSKSAAIDTAKVGGGSVIFRVVASDGVQSGQGDSAATTIAMQAPKPQIIGPANGARFEWGELINLRGEALDPQDGSVATNNLTWSNQNGVLGSGAQLGVAQLPVGENTLTLTATNSAGLSASTSIKITITDDLSEPGPTLAANPTTISWNSPSGSTAQLNANLTLSNTGGGSFTWTASSSAAWLKLGASSGNPGDSLAITADPSNFAPNSTTTAQILVQALSGTQVIQTLTIPVTVYVGNAGYGPPPKVIRSVYLPVARR